MRKLLVFVLFLLGVVAGYLAYTTFAPFGPAQQVLVDVPPGTSSRGIARMLVDAGVIRSETPFLAVRALRPNTTLQAGEYAFRGPASVWDVFGKIARGEIFYREVTVPEGSNMFDIAKALEDMGAMKAADFLSVARRPDLIRDIAPEAPSLEGYLFPATYRVTRRTTARQLAQDMTERFRRAWQELGAPKGEAHRITTLASLVEKESAVPAERPLVAAVYHNRLNIGMKLDCDPTVIYAALLEGRYRGTIYKSDLTNPHPYNTYMRPGLPPGAIANPGVEALRATLQPAQHDYLYFVAKPDGSGAHEFASTLAEHNANVQTYRRGLAR